MFLGFLALISVLDIALCTDGSLHLEKRSPSMGFMGLRGKKNDLLEEQQGNKRGVNTLGFSGMRGKKDATSDEITEPDEDMLDVYDKRGPTSNLGFNGMRGKKDSEDGFEKRARNTLGFSGLRGKKALGLGDGLDEDEDASGGMDKRGQQNTLGFSGMRGKKLEDLFDLEGKRARNTLGFSGMRGKKDDFLDDAIPEDVKRGGGVNSLGFSGMRGKKQDPRLSAGLLDQPDYDKRARTMSGFVGMRGRRDFWDTDGGINDEKRSPNGQAFVGMRGKRDRDEEALNYLLSAEAARDGIVTYRSKRYLPVNWPLRNSKKAPFSGFIGMRGKKSFFRPATGLSGSDNVLDLDQ